MSERFVEHAGLRFRCRVDGPEDAPWMVMSNSLVTDFTVWDDQVAAFAGRFRVLRYDQRGHGGTQVPGGPATIAELADDAAALMRSFGVMDAVFMGVSMGAATGFCIAQRHPELVARLVASDGTPASPPNAADVWQERIDVATRGGMPAYADVTIPRWFSARSQAEANPAIARARAMILRSPVAGFVACARALQGYDLTAGLAAMQQPALLVAGVEDGAIPAALRQAAGRMPRARFVEIADAAHIPGIERPGPFNAALSAFLR